MSTDKIKVLHYSTHDENDGIAKYQEQFIEAMTKNYSKVIYNEFFSYSPTTTRHMNHEEFMDVLHDLKIKLKDFDVLHVQHELSFYKHDELGRIVDAAKAMKKQVIFTVHTAPDAQYHYPRRHGYGLHSIAAYIREIRAAREFTHIHINPMLKADLILVHNAITKNNLIHHGVDGANIQIIVLPVPQVSLELVTTEIHDALHYQKGDVIIGLVGFISKTKGAKAAVRMLTYLPDHYKLAIVGGIHPTGADQKYFDEVCSLIIKLGLRERVYITGYIDDDQHLNGFVRECDACIYPYENKYYQYVSSAALNNAIANFKPAITYPTKSFIELNSDETIAITKSANYYELARFVKQIDYMKLADKSKSYAEKYSYSNEAEKLVSIYQRLVQQ